MKALSIKQPWAELILRGIKDVENRTWKTNHRGLLLIHTSKGLDADAMLALNNNEIPGIKWPDEFKVGNLPKGAIVGVCKIHICSFSKHSQWHEDGLWGWYLKNIRRFDEPIPYRGQLGLFDVPDDVVVGA